MQEKISILINATALFWWVYYHWRIDLLLPKQNIFVRLTSCHICTAFWSTVVCTYVAYLFPNFSQTATWFTFPFALAYVISKFDNNDSSNISA